VVVALKRNYMTDIIHKQKVLVVDDLRTNALALKKILQPEWAVQTAPDGETALRLALQNPPPVLILLDIQMPGMNGYEVCRQLKQLPETRDIPIIFITAMQTEKEEAAGLDLGAVDYIIKPVCPSVIRARVRTHITLQQALAELALTNQALADLAARDPLTGLFNRRKLDENFRQEVDRAARYGRPFSAILFDIDHFKSVNDRYGHPAGDDVLTETATWLRTALRTTDIPGRWGGEEFLVLCPETGLETALQLANRLRRDYEGYDFPGAIRLTASFGVATHCKGRTESDIFQSADAALYRAKHGGRNRVEQETS
jgi:diguanylate cyclase (GGDEF)-like protein